MFYPLNLLAGEGEDLFPRSTDHSPERSASMFDDTSFYTAPISGARRILLLLDRLRAWYKLTGNPDEGLQIRPDPQCHYSKPKYYKRYQRYDTTQRTRHGIVQAEAGFLR
jgi:hypothetical protein